MNLYTVTIRHSTVTFNLLIAANTKKKASKKAGKSIRANYPGFKITHIS